MKSISRFDYSGIGCVYIDFLESIGTLTLIYGPGGNGMEPESIRFELHEEYASYVEGKQL